MFIVLFLVPGLACATLVTPEQPVQPVQDQPLPDIEATVNAQVQATLAAGVSEGVISEPTPTPRPTPIEDVVPTLALPGLNLPFTDYFDAGLGGEWRVINGTPIVLDGRLGSIANQSLFVEIGNHELLNYSVEFDVFSASSDYGWGGYFSDLYLTLSPILKVQLSTADLNGTIDWIAWENDQWLKVNTSEFFDNDQDHFLVTVLGDHYTVYINGQIASELIYGPVRDTGAPLVVEIYGDNIFLDNLTIR